MEKLWKLVLFASLITPLLSLTTHHTTASFQEKNKSVTELRQALSAFSEAFVAADAERLSEMLTDDYLHCNSGSQPYTKTQWLNYIHSRRTALDNGSLRIDSYDNEEVIIKIYGDAAVINGLNIATGMQDGKPFATKIRFTHTWIKVKGQWKRASFHDSIIIKE